MNQTNRGVPGSKEWRASGEPVLAEVGAPFILSLGVAGYLSVMRPSAALWRLLRTGLGVLACSLSSGWVVAEAPPASDVLAVRATLKSGMVGRSWKLTLATAGKILLDTEYLGTITGTLTGEFYALEASIQILKKAIEVQRFMELPAQIDPGPVALHSPEVRLRVTLGAQTNEVTIRAPAAAIRDAEGKRFLAVWNAVAQLVPVKPEW